MAEKAKLTDHLTFDEKGTPKIELTSEQLIDHTGVEHVIKDGHLLTLEPMINVRRVPLVEIAQTISNYQTQRANIDTAIAELQALLADIVAGKIAEVGKVVPK